MGDDAYARYGRAWVTYLRLLNPYDAHYRGRDAEDRFKRALQRFVREGVVVVRWPTVWPSVEYLFGSSERFTEAVEAAVEELGGA